MQETTAAEVKEKPKYDRKVFSYTQMDMLSKCEEMWRRRYVCKDKIPPGVALIRGSSVHKGAEGNFVQKVKSHKDLKSSKIVEIAVAEFDIRVKTEGINLNEEEVARGKSVVLAEAKDSTVTLTGLYAKEVAPRHQPVMVETEQVILLGEKVDRDLVVKIDVVNEHKQIVDLKTASKSKNQDDVDNDLQFDVYGLAYQAINKEMPSSFVQEVLVNTKVPKVQSLVTTRTKKDLGPVINRFNAFVATAKRIEETNMAYPTRPDNWWCCPKFCGYHATCGYVKQR